jgi:hypothetical protein
VGQSLMRLVPVGLVNLAVLPQPDGVWRAGTPKMWQVTGLEASDFLGGSLSTAGDVYDNHGDQDAAGTFLWYRRPLS